MPQFNLEFAFDWNSRSLIRLTPFAQLQLCLTESTSESQRKMASFFGQMKVGDQLRVAIVDMTGQEGPSLELISSLVVFSRADRSGLAAASSRADPSGAAAASPLASRYLSSAALELAATRTVENNRAYNVLRAPTWSLGVQPIVHSGMFKFSASVIVFDPVANELRSYSVDPEMEVGSGNSTQAEEA